MKPRTLLWILLAAVAGGAALSYLMTGMAVSEASAIQRPNSIERPDSPIDSPLPSPGGAPSQATVTDPLSPADSAQPVTAEEALSLGEPGEHHEHLGRLAGDWDLTIRVWQSPDGEPLESAGTAEARWILGGRFLWTIYRAELFGEPFEAWSIEGYDNRAQQYVGTWRDTQGTYTLVYRGKCLLPPLAEGEKPTILVPDGKFRVMNTRVNDPVSGEALTVRTELRIQEDDSFVQQSFVILPGRGVNTLGSETPEDSIKNLELIGRRRGDG